VTIVVVMVTLHMRIVLPMDKNGFAGLLMRRKLIVASSPTVAISYVSATTSIAVVAVECNRRQTFGSDMT